jgi:hypothetical protein
VLGTRPPFATGAGFVTDGGEAAALVANPPKQWLFAAGAA